MNVLDKLGRGEIGKTLASQGGVLRTVLVFSMVINLLMLAPSIYMLQVYDRALPSGNQTTLLMLTLLMLLFFIFISAMEYVRSLVVIRVGSRIDLELNKRVYTAAFEQNLKKVGSPAGQALGDLATLRQFVTGNGLFAFMDVPWFPIYLVVMFLFDVWIGVFAVVGAGILVALAVINERVSHKPLSETSKLQVQSNTQATNTLRNAEVIEAMGMLPSLRGRWFESHEKYLTETARVSEKLGTISATTRFVRLSVQSLVLGLGAYLVMIGEMTPGLMIAGSILMGKVLGPVELLINVWRQWAGVRSAYERLSKLLEENPPRETGMPLPAPKGLVSVESVTAGPPGTRQAVLNNVSFKLEPGDVLAVVGPSGSGKSTLARLLVGVWAPQLGKVRLDGADLSQWNKDLLGPHLGYLPQDIELFAGTVAQNISRFGQSDSARVIAAAQQAGVHEMILRFPKGYDTELTDDGASLSAGQRQRIGLARALYGAPSLIVLDEPNSNLDEAGEMALAQTLRMLRESQRTVVLISHRANVLQLSTKLAFIRDGQLQAFGPTQQVLEAMAKAQQQQAQAAAGQAAPQGGQ
ncbi:MAG: type I secretion system permease/ATPase [Limnohabitans sp.]|nr:MAG: type I secretion system permease/ATPase [Limnohabitans sp.]